jgi:protease-4
VNVIARGRVWTGSDALKLGLVDKIGGLSAAISYAAKTASLKSKKVLYYPLKKEDKLIELLEQFEDEEDAEFSLQQQQLPKEILRYYQELKRIEAMSGIQMRMPYDIFIR